MELIQMRYFQMVAKYQNMSKAAGKLYITQPALSYSIKQMEEELGAALFDRYGRSIVLNDCGKIVLRYADRIASCVDEMKLELEDFKEQSDQVVSLSINISTSLLRNILPGFQKRHPDIRFRIEQNDTSWPDADNFDICINCSIQPPKCDEADNLRMVLTERVLLGMPKNHPLANRKIIQMSDVRGDPFMQVEGRELKTLAELCFQQSGIQPSMMMHCDSPSTVLDFIQLGLGISLIPEITWGSTAYDNILLKEIDGCSFQRHIVVAWRKTTYLTKSAAIFRDYLLHYFESIRPTLSITDHDNKQDM